MSLAQAPDAEMEREWQTWKARGVKADRRRAVAMGRVSSVIAIALAVWIVALWSAVR
jgi:hypothetical protein